MGATRHRFRSIVLIFPLLLLPAYTRADSFSSTVSLGICELPLGDFYCPASGGTFPGSMTAQTSGTLVGKDGTHILFGSATVDGPSLSATAQVQGNGMFGGYFYEAVANAQWNDTLTLTAAGFPVARTALDISLIPSLAPSLIFETNSPTDGIAAVNYNMSLFVSDRSLVPPGLDPGGGSVSCYEEQKYGFGGVITIGFACHPLDSYVLNGLPYSLHMSLLAEVQAESSDHNLVASDPFTLSLTPQRGVQIRSASGVSYVSTPSVPEPSSLFLMASGLLCLGPWGRKLLSRK